MKISIKRQFRGGEINFEVEDRDDDEAISKALFLAAPDYCSNCKSTEPLIWESNKATTMDGTFVYLKRRCLKCGATSTAGKYKAGGMFWKKAEVYQGKTEQDDQPKTYKDRADFIPPDAPPTPEQPF